MEKKLTKRILRLRGNKIAYALSQNDWADFDKLSFEYGESADGFLERLYSIYEFNKFKSFYLYPAVELNVPIVNEISEILNCRQKQTFEEAFTNYSYINNFIHEKSAIINSDNDLLNYWKGIKCGPNIPKITLNLRSTFYKIKDDPIIEFLKIGSNMEVGASSLLKSMFWDFCSVSELINDNDIEMLEKHDARIEESIKLKLLKKSFFPHYNLSTNIFVQYCLFEEHNFNFSFLSRAKDKTPKKDSLIVNFLMKDDEGAIVYFILPLLCMKFGRNQSEMFRLIILLCLKKYGLLDSNFKKYNDFEDLSKNVISGYKIISGKVKTEVARSEDDLIVFLSPWKKTTTN